jgi:hypothetical protein
MSRIMSASDAEGSVTKPDRQIKATYPRVKRVFVEARA